MALITLLTDFGTADGYVAAMKGVIVSEAPGAVVVDAGHEFAPQDIQAAAWALHQYWAAYPAGTIHVAVVDPEVGTGRRALLVEADGHFFLAPDNGVLTWVLTRATRWTARELFAGVHRPGPVSATFHGRDVFAFAAGRLAAGSPVAELAGPADELVLPAWPSVERTSNGFRGEIIHVDRFGNLISNITREHLEQAGGQRIQIRLGSHVVDRISRTYSDVRPGMALALIGSSGHLEIGVRNGSARERLAASRGDVVTVDARS